MGIFKRIRDIFGSNLNHTLDKLEDPAKMIRYSIVEMEKSLVKAKQSADSTHVAILSRKEELEDLKKYFSKWDVRVQLAVKGGKDELAREALMEKQEVGAKIKALEEEIEELTKINDSQNQQIAKIRQKLEEVKGKEQILIARAQHAKQKIEFEKQLNSTGCSAAFKRFNQMEEKIERLEAEASVATKAYETEGEFSNMETTDSIEKELSEMKASLEKAV